MRPPLTVGMIAPTVWADRAHSVGENPHSVGGFASHCGGFPSQCGGIPSHCEGVPSQCDARTRHSVGGIRPQCDDSDLVCHSGLVPPTFLVVRRAHVKRFTANARFTCTPFFRQACLVTKFSLARQYVFASGTCTIEP